MTGPAVDRRAKGHRHYCVLIMLDGTAQQFGSGTHWQRELAQPDADHGVPASWNLPASSGVPPKAKAAATISPAAPDDHDVRADDRVQSLIGKPVGRDRLVDVQVLEHHLDPSQCS